MDSNQNIDAQKQSVSNESYESEMQKKIDQQLESEPFKDMHLESGEKINEYED